MGEGGFHAPMTDGSEKLMSNRVTSPKNSKTINFKLLNLLNRNDVSLKLQMLHSW